MATVKNPLRPAQRLSGQAIRPPVGGGASQRTAIMPIERMQNKLTGAGGEPIVRDPRQNLGAPMAKANVALEAIKGPQQQSLVPIDHRAEARANPTEMSFVPGKGFVPGASNKYGTSMIAAGMTPGQRQAAALKAAGGSTGSAKLQPAKGGTVTHKGAGLSGEGIDLRDTGAVIEDFLKNPSGFDQETFKRTRDAAYADLDAQAKAALGKVRSSAASRGMFFGTPLTTAEGDLSATLQRAKANVNAGLLQRQAELQGTDLQRAIQTAMQFGQNTNAANQSQSQLGQNLLSSGSQGMPSGAQLLQLFGGKNTKTIDPALLQMLGSFMGNRGG